MKGDPAEEKPEEEEGGTQQNGGVESVAIYQDKHGMDEPLLEDTGQMKPPTSRAHFLLQMLAVVLIVGAVAGGVVMSQSKHQNLRKPTPAPPQPRPKPTPPPTPSLTLPPSPEFNCTGKSAGLSPIACNTWQSLFDAWGGLKWKNCNDKKTDPCSCTQEKPSFDYVTCQGADIVMLYLEATGLTGSIPSFLGSLTSLTELVLGANALTGTIPSFLGSLTSLEELHFFDNALTGSIPSSLGSLTSLTILNIQENRLTGSIPSSLGSLTSLFALGLNFNGLTGTIPSFLGSLTSLTEFALQCNSLEGTVPALPWSQYKDGCIVGGPETPVCGSHTRGMKGYSPNQFACPLPQGAATCKAGGNLPSCK